MIFFLSDYFLARHVAGQGAVGLDVSGESRLKGDTAFAPVPEMVPMAHRRDGFHPHLIIPIDQIGAVVIALTVEMAATGISVFFHVEGELGVPALEAVHQFIHFFVPQVGHIK